MILSSLIFYWKLSGLEGLTGGWEIATLRLWFVVTVKLDNRVHTTTTVKTGNLCFGDPKRFPLPGWHFQK